MRRDIITMENALRMEDDVLKSLLKYDKDHKTIETIEDLIQWSDDFRDKVRTNLKAQGLKKDNIIDQYHAVGLSMAYNSTDIPFDKTFLDTLDNKNKRDIVQLIRLGNSLRFFATNNDEDQFLGAVKIFHKNYGRMQNYKDYYKEIEQ